MAAISTRTAQVTVEYDTAKGRAKKNFKDANEAKTFFAKQDKAKKNPKVISDAPAAEAPVAAPTSAPAVEASKIKGVDANVKSRPYYAGVVLAKYGLELGVTDEMVAEVDKLYGRSNPREAKFALRNAHGVLRGRMATTTQQKQS